MNWLIGVLLHDCYLQDIKVKYDLDVSITIASPCVLRIPAERSLFYSVQDFSWIQIAACTCRRY